MTRPRVVHHRGSFWLVGSSPNDMEAMHASCRRAQRQGLAVWLLLTFLALAAAVAAVVHQHTGQANVLLGEESSDAR